MSVEDAVFAALRAEVLPGVTVSQVPKLQREVSTNLGKEMKWTWGGSLGPAAAPAAPGNGACSSAVRCLRRCWIGEEVIASWIGLVTTGF